LTVLSQPHYDDAKRRGGWSAALRASPTIYMAATRARTAVDKHRAPWTDEGVKTRMKMVLTRDARTRVQMEYVETPALKLTLRQAGRLCELTLDECRSALGALVEEGFLVQTEDGTFLRNEARPTLAEMMAAWDVTTDRRAFPAG